MFAYITLIVGIMSVCIKVSISSNINNPLQAQGLGIFPATEISMGVLSFLLTIFAGMIGFLTYLFSEIATEKDLLHAKLMLAILFPVILALLFKDISQSYALNMSSTLCFVVGYNFKTLLLFTGKILEKVNNVIQRI
ncbi:hypothetical protein [Paenibacillus sp. WLX2291]|uniref:hypothetical protein n=1 Tax=Paenibacillus sp. WLX2291 TaxID=3296934 RepID=UPI0039842DC2